MLIGLRNGLMAGKKLSAKSYVQDGLVAMWDGIENAGWGVHDPNATVWKNVAKDSWHLNVVPDATWLETCLHSGNTQYYIAGLNGSENIIPLDKARTIEMVFSYKKNPNTYPRYDTCYFFTDWNGLDMSGRMFLASSGKVLGHCRGTKTYRYFSESDLPDNTVAAWTLTYPEVTEVPLRFTRDGVSAPTTVYGTFNRSPSTGIYVGGSTSSTSAHRGSMNGNVYCVRVYSRVLTVAEIAANYAVDKARFNLPTA